MSDAAPSRRKNRYARSAVVLAMLAGFVLVLLYRDQIDADAIEAWARNHSVWETAIEFVLVHVIASLFFVPRLFLGLAAGALFGPYLGSVLSIIGGTLGALAGFVMVRFVNGDSVRLRETPAIGQWLDKAEAQGWRLVFIVRLIPILPHSLVNYVFGLSRISTMAYVTASALGMLPTAIIYTNLGASGRDAVADSSNFVLLGAWGLGLIFVSWLLPKIARRVFPSLNS